MRVSVIFNGEFTALAKLYQNGYGVAYKLHFLLIAAVDNK